MSKTLIILGAGESGIGAALLGKAKGYDVFVADSGQICTDRKGELLAHEIRFEEGVLADDRSNEMSGQMRSVHEISLDFFTAMILHENQTDCCLPNSYILLMVLCPGLLQKSGQASNKTGKKGRRMAASLSPISRIVK